MRSVQPPVRHFFVDEAGDTTLFDRRGRLLVGSEGVSRTFMVGICELSDPKVADARLAELRAELLNDPYFRGVPSMAPTARKRARSFHAKDDIPEVRREVFTLISQFHPSVFVAFRRKDEYAAFAREQYRLHGHKVGSNLIYDDLVEKTCTHLPHNQPVLVASGVPSGSGGLQVTDYLLWALQRMIERGEDRYFTSVASHFRLIMDLDDRRHQPYGEWYSDSNPLSLKTLKPIVSG